MCTYHTVRLWCIVRAGATRVECSASHKLSTSRAEKENRWPEDSLGFIAGLLRLFEIIAVDVMFKGVPRLIWTSWACHTGIMFTGRAASACCCKCVKIFLRRSSGEFKCYDMSRSCWEWLREARRYAYIGFFVARRWFFVGFGFEIEATLDVSMCSVLG